MITRHSFISPEQPGLHSNSSKTCFTLPQVFQPFYDSSYSNLNKSNNRNYIKGILRGLSDACGVLSTAPSIQ